MGDYPSSPNRRYWSRLLRFLATMGFGAWLVACSPPYDWRETSAAGGWVQVAFPGRPVLATRDLPIADSTIPFTLETVQTQGASFAVGSLDTSALPGFELGEAAQQSWQTALISSLTRPFQAEEIQRQTVTVRSLRGGPDLLAEEIKAESADQGLRLLARVVQREDRWIQVVAIGPKDRLSWETAQWFVESTRLP